MFEDLESEFVAPLVAEHVKNGGQAPSAEQVEATCAMLLAKILWDVKLGNPDQAVVLRMLGARLGRGATDTASPKGGDSDLATQREGSRVEQKDEGDVPGSVVEIAAALFEGLKDSWARIMRELATDAGISVDDTSPKGVWFRIECLIFEWFVRDFVIAHHVEKGGVFAAVLVSTGKSKNKMQIVTAVHHVTGLGLEEAKALVDSAPKPIKEGISKAEADEIRKKLEVAGAIVQVKQGVAKEDSTLGPSLGTGATDAASAHADAIRDHLMYFVYEALREAVRVEGMPEEVLREFDRRRMERFNEYYEAFVAQRHERKRWWGLERLGFLAAERIVGSRDPIACVVLSSEAAGVYKSLGRVARQIKVVGQ
jgi:hypothetical protein